jgi:hypothetical protein
MRPFYSDFEPIDASRFGAMDHYAEEHHHFNRWEDSEPTAPPAPPTTTEPQKETPCDQD